jgi:hypothetical protein
MSVIRFPKKSTRDAARSITGRDGYLVLQALAYAIVTIERLHKKQQELLNKEQMKTLLDVWSRGQADDFLEKARCHVTGWSEGRSDYFLDNARRHIEGSPSHRSQMGDGFLRIKP